MPTDDYIKRSDINDAMRKWWANDDDRRSFAEVVRDIPAAEVVPAPVRCSECRFYDKRDGGAPGGTGWCSRSGAGCGVPEEFFCAGAERKEKK